jgi:hypothetical protein
MTLADFALSLTTPAGIGVALSFLVEYYAGDWFHTLSMKIKRVVLFLISLIIAGAGYALLLYSGSILPPMTNYDMLEHVWQYCILPAASVFSSATVTHGFLVDRYGE